MPNPPTPEPVKSYLKEYDIDDLIDRITAYAKDWSDHGIDLFPDGVEQFRAGLYAIFGIPIPPGERPDDALPPFCPACGRRHP